MINVRLLIAYDGTHYLGWQKTSTGPSIEETLQTVLQKILQEPVSLQAASRTDAGVHAEGQVVNFISLKTHLDFDRLQVSLNQLLPPDIAVRQAAVMPPQFHPTLDCKGKTYHYDLTLGCAQQPKYRLYSWHCPYDLDLTAMHRAATFIVGEHDFSSFCNFKKNSTYRDYVRTVHRVEIRSLENQRLRFEIGGNHFLYKMVRNIIGTLVYVGRGKLQADQIPKILKDQDRTLAGMTAPAHGLTLFEVAY